MFRREATDMMAPADLTAKPMRRRRTMRPTVDYESGASFVSANFGEVENSLDCRLDECTEVSSRDRRILLSPVPEGTALKSSIPPRISLAPSGRENVTKKCLSLKSENSLEGGLQLVGDLGRDLAMAAIVAEMSELRVSLAEALRKRCDANEEAKIFLEAKSSSDEVLRKELKQARKDLSLTKQELAMSKATVRQLQQQLRLSEVKEHAASAYRNQDLIVLRHSTNLVSSQLRELHRQLVMKDKEAIILRDEVKDLRAALKTDLSNQLQAASSRVSTGRKTGAIHSSGSHSSQHQTAERGWLLSESTTATSLETHHHCIPNAAESKDYDTLEEEYRASENDEGKVAMSSPRPRDLDGAVDFSVCPIYGTPKFTAVKEDAVDVAVGKFAENRENKILFTRVEEGVYLFGRIPVKVYFGFNGKLNIMNSKGEEMRLDTFVEQTESQEFSELEASLGSPTQTILTSPRGKQKLTIQSPLTSPREYHCTATTRMSLEGSVSSPRAPYTPRETPRERETPRDTPRDLISPRHDSMAGESPRHRKLIDVESRCDSVATDQWSSNASSCLPKAKPQRGSLGSTKLIKQSQPLIRSASPRAPYNPEASDARSLLLRASGREEAEALLWREADVGQLGTGRTSRPKLSGAESCGTHEYGRYEKLESPRKATLAPAADDEKASYDYIIIGKGSRCDSNSIRASASDRQHRSSKQHKILSAQAQAVNSSTGSDQRQSIGNIRPPSYVLGFTSGRVIPISGRDENYIHSADEKSPRDSNRGRSTRRQYQSVNDYSKHRPSRQSRSAQPLIGNVKSIPRMEPADVYGASYDGGIARYVQQQPPPKWDALPSVHGHYRNGFRDSERSTSVSRHTTKFVTSSIRMTPKIIL